MNTPAHLLIGAAVFGRPAKPSTIGAALIGALLPDVSLYLMAGFSLLVLQISPQIVFRELYYSDSWQMVFAIDNSFILWGALFGIAIWLKRSWAIALTGAAVLHLALDFPLHHDDGRSHFWPATWWVFESPLSYWDRQHGAQWIAPIEGILASIAVITLWVRKAPWWVFAICLPLLFVELWIVRQWLFYFTRS